MRESAISARIDSETKRKVEEIFKKLGLSHSSAINLFYSQILLHDGLPFEMKMKKTVEIADNCSEVAEPQVVYNQSESVKLLVEYFLNEIANRINPGKNRTQYNRNEILKKVVSAKRKYKGSGFMIIGIFGSYARNEADENSDVDILYELTPVFREKHKGFKAIAEISRIKDELEKHFGLKVDLVDRATQKKNSKNSILNEAVYV